MNKFNAFLYNLGFSDKVITETDECIFEYNLNVQESIYYTYTPTIEDVYDKHLDFWNRNNTNTFIAVGDDKSYLIHAKQKPNKENPVTNNIAIKKFDYGINTESFEKEKVKEITKDYIDSTYFFNFVTTQIANKKKLEVDKHLLLNLISLRNDLLALHHDEETVHLLILRSLFIKYLEDKGIYDSGYWEGVLSSNEPKNILKAFNRIKRINGDIFDENLPIEKINPLYIPKLYQFFTSDYRTGQKSIFPYLFDKIPIQLISHVYEAFLRSDEKKGKGIYYTPSFVVNFMLSHTLKDKLTENKNVTILDPAVGSAAFLVESFKTIINSFPKNEISYEKKKTILQEQLFGIDIDQKALQIAAFSLYLTLIETEKPEFIRKQIEDSHPILPSLIGKSLICANALTDEVFSGKTFDCIVSNPPWGSAEPNGDEQNEKERKAIATKGKTGTMPEYKNVADYERSQAFLIRVKKWSNENTIFSLIVKNSIFLNDNSLDFRRELLKQYQINYFYELSNYNKILFKKQKIGEINGQTIELGATEPCAVLVYELPKNEKHFVKYISPKLNGFSESFQLIHYTQKDINEVEQQQFIEDDLLWRVLVNGSKEEYNLIRKIQDSTNVLDIECRAGFQPKANMSSLGEPIWKLLIEPTDFERYHVKKNLKRFNWNQDLHRRRNQEIFKGKRMLLPVRPLNEDRLRFRAIELSEEIVHKHNILTIKLKESSNYIDELRPYLGLFNSKLIGFYFFNISSQWGKGEEKRDTIRNIDIERLPIFKIDKKEPNYNALLKLVIEIEKNSALKDIVEGIEKEIDKLVFELYDLKDYQKEIINEFYQIKVERAKNKQVNKSDIEKYIKKFTEVFEHMLEDGNKLIAASKISQNVGAVVSFKIGDEKEIAKPSEYKNLEILNFVKKKQISEADRNKILNEDKVKIYDNEFMFIIKSNQFKDWTVRQAIKDAREEIGLLLSKLPDTHA